MGIRYLNGRRLRYAILAGTEKVVDSREQINKINVFPVPDGDTGNNMASTLSHISNESMAIKKNDLSSVSESLADSALMGARGNSGAIIAQFFQGLAEALRSKARIELEQFSEAINTATEKARQAMTHPADGTIITVMQDWADSIKLHWRKADNFEQLFRMSLDSAKKSLASTTDKLESLKQANVVDAGALGFVNFLQGVMDGFRKRKSYRSLHRKNAQSFNFQNTIIMQDEEVQHSVQVSAQSLSSGELQYQYCTECIIQDPTVNVEKLKQELDDWGDSLVVVAGSKKIKIHIHTNDPKRLFNYVSQTGEVIGIKADDMWAQYRGCIGWHNNKDIALITDSAANLPQEFIVKYNIQLIPMQLIGKKTYFDRINLSLDHFYRILAQGDMTFSTSQPLPGDIQTSITKARQGAKAAVMITISDKLSGTYQSVAQCAHSEAHLPIKVIDSKSLATGQGLLVMLAAEAIHKETSLSRLQLKLHRAAENIQMICKIGSVDALVRSGRIPRAVGKIAQWLHLIPIIRSNDEGKLEKIGLAWGNYFAHRKLLKLIHKALANQPNPRFLISHANAARAANQLAKKLKVAYKLADIPVIDSCTSVVVHCGIGSVSVAFCTLPD